ncbi:serine/threonine-protein phosphatase 2A regulatory subunit B'' subunit gamma isoform 2 [Thraustotheca clavata]|uniref:Serine/threonine-protein phosphatase 2A regulatory subunit B'' subunit gamma isoform 2 n=1 Tax=Thraustotheca clavata TaxID=74557 RepID=A0A1W0A5Y3_9STRA|nr:serine/threonine-protein phosphatase 2A regulatory subunit B'' subunit gamma isoform 2 [Thraustotheca clavata]
MSIKLSSVVFPTRSGNCANVLELFKEHVNQVCLDWKQVQELITKIYEVVTLVPAENQICKWIETQEDEINQRMEIDEKYVPPPTFEEIQCMKQWLDIPKLNYLQFRACTSKLPKQFTLASVFMQFRQDSYGRINGLLWVDLIQLTSLQLQSHLLLIFSGNLVIERVRTHTYCHAMINLLCPEFHSSIEYAANPFTIEAISTIHRQYLQLDTDKDGMLSRQEMLSYGRKKAFANENGHATHELTKQFIDRVFDMSITYNDELDYKSFLDINIRLQDKTSKSSLQFFWRVLDMSEMGFIDSTVIDYFLKGIAEKVFLATEGHLDVQILRSELFDMIQPKNPFKITLDDLASSHAGQTFVRVLTDYEAYLKYERQAK